MNLKSNPLKLGLFFCYRITITTKGKYTAINAGAIEPLVSLVDDDKSEVRINALKVSLVTTKSFVCVHVHMHACICMHVCTELHTFVLAHMYRLDYCQIPNP